MFSEAYSNYSRRLIHSICFTREGFVIDESHSGSIYFADAKYDISAIADTICVSHAICRWRDKKESPFRGLLFTEVAEAFYGSKRKLQIVIQKKYGFILC